MELPEEFRNLMKDLSEKIGETNKERKTENLTELTHEELEEFNSINAMMNSLQTRLSHIYKETGDLEERKTSFWYQLRKNHNILHENHLMIDEGIIKRIID